VSASFYLRLQELHAYLPAEYEKKPGDDYVMPKLLDCNHAVCEYCAANCYEDKVAFVGHGVRCPFHKRDQSGREPYVCGFVTPRKPEELEDAMENRIIAKVLRDTEVLLGTSQPKKYKNREFFYYYKFCHECQHLSTCVCKNCMLPFCDDCWKGHKGGENSGHECWSLADYDKEKVQSHKCDVCHNRAYKYCGICKKFYCRNRKGCYDPCMDPDHLLIDFDPSIVELKRFEATAMDNARKMFIHDMHDYLETNPFLWQAADMECLHRTVWHEAHEIAQKKKGSVPTTEEQVEEAEKEDERKKEDDKKRDEPKDAEKRGNEGIDDDDDKEDEDDQEGD